MLERLRMSFYCQSLKIWLIIMIRFSPEPHNWPAFK